jgi:NAD(P)-dependent dehydrogenase (short-subunit alcohol dehydrogenase family)
LVGVGAHQESVPQRPLIFTLVVSVIDFVTSERAGWINGQDIQVDGGYRASLVAGALA